MLCWRRFVRLSLKQMLTLSWSNDSEKMSGWSPAKLNVGLILGHHNKCWNKLINTIESRTLGNFENVTCINERERKDDTNDNFITFVNYSKALPSKHETLTNVVLMLDWRRRRWASIKTDLIFLGLGFSKRKFLWNCYQYMRIFLNLSPTSSHRHPLQIRNCDMMKMTMVNSGLRGLNKLRWCYNV